MMNKNRYLHLCDSALAGEDAFVRHPVSNEEGVITSCVPQTGHVVVRTADDQARCWDYRECEELEHPKSGPMI